MLDENGKETVIPQVEPEVTPAEPSKDPLDAIENEDTRNDMKRLRSIDQRRAKKEIEEPKPAEPQNNYATKDDLKVMATNEAKKLVAPEVLAAWDELTKIPLGGYDPMDAGAMAQNMAQRYTLHQQANPDATDPTREITDSPFVPASGSSGPKAKATDSKPLPNFKEAAQPADWYGKAE